MKKPSKKEILYALASMWEQYCPPPYGHSFMSAGENAEEVLEDCGLLKKDGYINWDLLNK